MAAENSTQLQPEVTKQPVDETAAVRDYVHEITDVLVPASVEEADRGVHMARSYERAIRDRVKSGEVTVDTDYQRDLRHIARAGVRTWILSPTEHTDYSNITAASKPTDLSETAAAYLEGADELSFARLKKQAAARLKISDALESREIERQRARAEQDQSSNKFNSVSMTNAATRPQGAPDYHSVEPVMVAAAGKKVEIPGSAKPRVVTSTRQAATRPQGPVESSKPKANQQRAELEGKIDAAQRSLRFYLGSRAVERMSDGQGYLRAQAIRQVRAAGNDMSPLEPARPAKTPARTATSLKGKPIHDEGKDYAIAELRRNSLGAKHAYVTTRDGELRHISYDRILAEQGFAGQTQPKREGLLGLYGDIIEQERKDGVKILYGVSKDGKKYQLKFDDVLAYYSHRGEKQGADDPDTYRYELDNETGEVRVAPVDTGAEPVTALTGKSLRARLGRIMTKARSQLLKIQVEAQTHLFESSNRRKVAAGVIGGVALAGATYMAFRGLGTSHSNGHELAQQALGHRSGGHTLNPQQTLNALTGQTGKTVVGHSKSPEQIMQALTGQTPAASGKHTMTPSEILGTLTGHGKSTEHLTKLAVHRGDMPWDVLRHAGVPQDEIMHRLDEAAKQSGLNYSWHGSGEHRWLEVAGKSDTKDVIKLISSYVKR